MCQLFSASGILLSGRIVRPGNVKGQRRITTASVRHRVASGGNLQSYVSVRGSFGRAIHVPQERRKETAL